jgi:hypothetical protein
MSVLLNVKLICYQFWCTRYAFRLLNETTFFSLPLCYINSVPFRLDQALTGIQLCFPQAKHVFLCIHFQNVRKIFQTSSVIQEFLVFRPQIMLTPSKRQIPPMVYPEVCVCLILLFELVFPTGLVRLSCSYVWYFIHCTFHVKVAFFPNCNYLGCPK